MKKYSLLPVLMLLSFFLYSQDDLVIKGTKKITKKMTPQQVIDSLNKRFPNAQSVQYYKDKSPADSARGWNVTEEDNLDSDAEVEYYTISFKRDGLKYYGLYDKDGNLLKSKIEERVTNLPEPITASLKKLQEQYPGYTVVSKTYYKNQNYSKSKEYYEVYATKGSTKKTVVYNADGTIVKVK